MQTKTSEFCRFLLLAASLVVMPALPSAYAEGDRDQEETAMASDQEAIEELLMIQYRAFAQHDPEPMRSIYAEDADWTNAFGRTISGRDDILSYYDELFADPNFSDGQMVGEPQVSTRAVGEDAVAVKTYAEVEGQRTVDGGVIPTRHNFSLKLLGRQSDGSWKIVSEMFMDARREVTHLEADPNGDEDNEN